MQAFLFLQAIKTKKNLIKVKITQKVLKNSENLPNFKISVECEKNERNKNGK